MQNTSNVRVLSRLLVAVALSIGAFTGCGDACEDLQPICDRCTDADYKTSCDQTVAQGNQALCDSRKGVFNGECPFVLDPSTTTSSDSSSAASGVGGSGVGGSSATTTSANGGSAAGGAAGGMGGGTAGAGGT